MSARIAGNLAIEHRQPALSQSGAELTLALPVSRTSARMVRVEARSSAAAKLARDIFAATNVGATAVDRLEAAVLYANAALNAAKRRMRGRSW